MPGSVSRSILVEQPRNFKLFWVRGFIVISKSFNICKKNITFWMPGLVSRSIFVQKHWNFKLFWFSHSQAASQPARQPRPASQAVTGGQPATASQPASAPNRPWIRFSTKLLPEVQNRQLLPMHFFKHSILENSRPAGLPASQAIQYFAGHVATSVYQNAFGI